MNALKLLARALVRVLSLLGSLVLGVVLMILLALAMGWATFLEREMGTPVAQYLVYASQWFYALIAALAGNVLCAAILRLPKLVRQTPDENGRMRRRFNSRLIPFYFAHLGTIALILGCWITAKESVKARAVIPEGTAVEKAINVESHAINVEIARFDELEQPDQIRIPFNGGPLNWRDQESSALWRANVAEPILNQKPETNFFQRLAKRASTYSQRLAFYAANYARRGHNALLYDADDLKIEVLEYAPLADYAPVSTLELSLKTRANVGEERPLDVTLEFPFDAMAIGGDPLATSRRAQRKVLDSGVRIVYLVADSDAEANAFTTLTRRPEEPNDLLTLVLDGVRYAVPLEKLALLSRYGDPTAQLASYRAQRDEIERRSRVERERDDASNAEDAKPLQTVDRDALVEKNKELRELSDQLAQLANDPTREKETQALSQEFLHKRTLNYLATTWAQLESSTSTSKEFAETLDKMIAQTDERLKELDELEKNARLGNDGWKIVALETSPTLLQGVDELQGWTARVVLESPQGTREEATLHSELPERNRYPESGRVFGALWLAEPSGDDNEYGRKWSGVLNCAKLEIMQPRSVGDAPYALWRYNDGANRAQSGVLLLSLQNAETETFASSPITLDVGDADGDQITELAVKGLAFQDELGARLMPTLFQKELANEFYGKVKLRVSFDDVVETFWLRAIPLESVSQEQRDYLTKRLASSKRRIVLSLTDEEIELGAALFVKRFTPTYEPGSSTPASFESVVQMLPKGLSREEQIDAITSNDQDVVVIRMNRPGVIKAPNASKAYWAYQDSYRGPFKPGDSEFDAVTQGALLPGENTPRDVLYHTIISFNNDPGRGIKYLACLFIVWGTALLVYRRANKSNPPSLQTNETNRQENETSDSMIHKTSPTTTLVLLAILPCILAAPTARADEIVPEDIRDAKTPTVKRTRDEIDWTPWRLLPVFDGGRVQPLNTFAEIVVHEITGDASPTIKIPPTTLQQLDGDAPVNFPTLEEFLADLAQDNQDDETASSQREEQERWYRDVAAQAVEQQRDIAERLRAIFPNGERKFNAAELLFSWLAEPELWEFVPFLDDPKSEIARDALKLNAEAVDARNYRIAPADCDALAPGSTKTMLELYRAETAHAKKPGSKALDKLENNVATFRSLTFAPLHSSSSQPQERLNKILYGAATNHPGGAIAVSPINKLAAATERMESLLAREKRALRKKSPFNDKEFFLRKRIPIEGDAQGRDTLALARQVAILAGLYRRYPLATVDLMFQKLLDATSDALNTLRTHRNEIIASGEFSLEYRQELMRVVSALEDINDLLEDAYLALVTETPKAIAVAPLIRERVFRSFESQDSPWLSLQTLLWAPDAAYQRFVEPEPAPNAVENDSGHENASQFDALPVALQKMLDASSHERLPARAFLDAARAYRDRAVENRAERVSEALERFAAELRAAAQRSEVKRARLAENVERDPHKREELLRKTAYPAPGALNAELFYYRLNAFYWNWLACLLAVGALVVSYARQIIWRVRFGAAEPPRQERLFFALGIALLAISCGVAFLGGSVRAYITGWAPVANMFETVVLLAFLIAAIAIGYTLAPLWSRPFGAAWRATAFTRRAHGSPSRGVGALLLVLRLALTLGVGYLGVRLWLASQTADASVWDAFKKTLANSLAMQGVLDSCAAFATFLFVAVLAPRFVVALIALVLCPRAVLADLAPNETAVADLFSRKAFLTASAVVATLVAAAAYFNSVEFNPHIRPLVAVLRSNFWLTIHVIAIIVSYALGAIAWVVALTSLAAYLFGRYDQLRDSDPTPSYSLRVAPFIVAMTRSAVLFLTVGIILGARWADFSWGRFWSWDPKEVWALVTLFVYLVVLHVYKMTNHRRFFLPIGATLGALAIIMTWYGLSFVMGGGGRHAYASGESNKVTALYILFAANIGWALMASIRYIIQSRTIRKSK